MQQASEQTHSAIERSESNSERRCLVRGESGGKEPLIRFAVSPDNVVVPDISEKLPGRGLWVTADAACIQQAIEKKLFGRAAKQQVTAPAELLEQTRMLLRQRVLDLLGLMKKSGDVIVGSDATLAAIKAKPLAGVIVAADVSDAGLNDMANRTGQIIHTALTAAELGAALGRDNTVYMAIPANRQGHSLVREFQRYQSLMKEESHD